MAAQFYDERLQQVMRKLKEDLKTSTEPAVQGRALSQGLPTYFPDGFHSVRVHTPQIRQCSFMQSPVKHVPNFAFVVSLGPPRCYAAGYSSESSLINQGDCGGRQ